MGKITLTQLQHLSKLSKTPLPLGKEEQMLQQIDQIIDFLDQLPEPKSEKDINPENKLHPFSETKTFNDADSLLKNSKHPLKNNSITIKTSL